MAARDIGLLRGSLVFVWLATAGASVWEAHGRSAALLQQAGVAGTAVGVAMLWGGVALDVAIGLLLWRAPLRLAATAALVTTLSMTVVTSAVLPGLWLDPLGALVKNLPIIAALLVLRRNAP
ncbi:MAG: DoxX-like family protein [Vitreoscilla sp.]